MDPKPSLSKYFGESEIPPASQFFDEIGAAPGDMIQSVYLGENEVNQTTTASLFPHTMTASFTQHKSSTEMTLSKVVPTVSGLTALPATSLPDPSTFFDTIVTEPHFGADERTITTPVALTQALDGLAIVNAQEDPEGNRRRDAWIPNEEAKKTLLKAQSSPKGSFFPDRDVLTMPGLILEEELGDALQEVAVKHLGVSEAGSRGVLRQEHVSRDEAGLRELIRSGYLRAAVNLTHTLLDAHGQGVGRMNRPTKHTPRSLQLWLTRFSLLVKIKLNDILEKEAESFGDLTKPDMFYQFYPEVYSNRRGTIVPFALRLLLAELPMHFGRANDAMDRLYILLGVIKQMILNLEDGKTEDGTSSISSESDKSESLKLWSGRKTRVLHSIVNCALALKEYRIAIDIIESLCREDGTVWTRRALRSALVRVCLHAGHVKMAQVYLQAATELRNHICATPDVREYVDLGLIDVANGKYQDAYNNFMKAADQEPTNIMIANNSAACLLYMGKLKQAIAVLEAAIKSNPDKGLNDKLLLNLCTLYELESSKTNEKKLQLLRMLCKYKSDTIPNVLECLKLT